MWLNNKGFALLNTLVVAAVMSVMAIAMTFTALDLQKASQNTLAMQRALNATEAGISTEMQLGMPCGSPGTSEQIIWTTLGELGSSYEYRAQIQRIDLPLAWLPAASGSSDAQAASASPR